jgi:diacylglycerol kinase (ATP)
VGVPEPSTPLIVVNPIAGNGRAHGLAPRIETWLAERDIRARLVETRERGHAERLAAAAGDLGHDRVVVVGGDGTIQEVVNGLLDGAGGATVASRPSLGIVPGGSGNDLVRDLILPLDSMAALRVALGTTTRAVDIARAIDGEGRVRHFHAAGGVGFDAQVAEVMFGHRWPWQRGRVGYFASTFIELLRFHNRRIQVRMETEEGPRQVEQVCLLVAVSNGAYYGGGMQICPGAEMDDGLLDICLAGDLTTIEALRLLPGIYHGAHVGHPKVAFHRASSIRFEGDEGTLVHLDGEPFGKLPVSIDVIPGALDVAVGDSGIVGT